MPAAPNPLPQPQDHDHDHAHGHDGAVLLEQVDQACRQRGLRLTALRRRVMELIAGEGRPVKAYDLLEMIRQERGGAAPPTVYRALDFLLEHGFIHKLESLNAFIGCDHPHGSGDPGVGHQPPFLICDCCKVTVEMEDSLAAGALAAEARRLGFTPQAQTLEIHGLCARCSGP
jgi:Fur family zinc uptake transcriptional regulator